MNRLSCTAASLCLASGVLSGPASAVTLVNGSLESSSPGFIELVSSPAASNGWDTSLANIEYVKNGYASAGDVIASAHSGEWFVDLNGTDGPGGISQQIDAATSQQYVVNFWMSGNAGPSGTTSGDGSRTLDVLWNGVLVGDARFDFQDGDRWNNLRWEKHSVIVTGGVGLDTLEFRSTSTAYAFAGPLIDTISVTPVPEPETWALLGAGLALLAMGTRRRRAG